MIETRCTMREFLGIDKSVYTSPTTIDTTYSNIKIGGHPKFNQLLQEMAELHAKKDHDYAGDKHLSNFEECEKFNIPAWKGVLVRLSDKWSRVKSLVKKGGNKVKDESLIDTLMDISVYALITIILLEEAKRDTQTEEKAC